MKHLLSRSLLSLGVLVALGLPASAFAQDGDYTIILTPGASTTTTTGVVITMTADGISSSTSSTERIFGCAQTEVYLKHNAVAVRQGVSLGGGEAVQDLARLGSIAPEDHAAFGRLLRRERKDLMAILTIENLDAEATATFGEVLRAAMGEDEVLAKYVRDAS